MVRTQIQLEEHQARRLKSVARQKGVSMAEIVRRLVDRGLDNEKTDRAELYSRAAGLIGRFPDREDADDLAEDHDRYLEQAFE